MNTAIRFYLNGKEQHIDGFKPDTTLLNWLRLEKDSPEQKKDAPKAIVVPVRWLLHPSMHQDKSSIKRLMPVFFFCRC